MRTLFPGVVVCLTVAAAAQFLASHYEAPQMLFALLLGMAFHFLSEEKASAPGVEFSARIVLRIGVALLGLRITFSDIAGLGPANVLLVSTGVFATILFGVLLATLFRKKIGFGILTGGAVAICGASAALAISSILPKSKDSERNTIFTVVAVTTFSTIAMIVYPVLAIALGHGDKTAGIFLGATIHDVAQVVGAGYTISSEAGDVATVTKLFRVALLVPVVLLLSLFFRGRQSYSNRFPLPLFVVGFCLLAGINSWGVLPGVVQSWLIDLSRWCLVTAIAALGIKTSLKTLSTIGYQAVGLIVAETVFIAAWVLVGMAYLAQ